MAAVVDLLSGSLEEGSSAGCSLADSNADAVAEPLTGSPEESFSSGCSLADS
ncbi:MAG: hypothetical protein ABIJ12_04055 [bacterium]